jgi:recombinational DNA repair protein RecT
MGSVSKNPQQQFRALAVASATGILRDWVGEERAAEAIGRVSTAIAAAAASAKKPQDFYQCTPASVATVIAISALTGVMPSTGATALAYAIPRRPRQGEPLQLTYQLSHRGVCALAERSGSKIVPIPVGMDDDIAVGPDGEVRVNSIDIDNPPTTEAELRGVIVLVKDRQTGRVLFTGYVAKKLINARRAVSQDWKYSGDKSIWATWYVEQAMKTACHYAMGRGWVVVDDTSVQRALSADVTADVAEQPPRPQNIGEVIEGVTVEGEVIEEAEAEATE